MIHWLAVAALIFAFTYEKDANAAQSSISFLHGDGYATGDDTRNIVRVDTMAVKDWGLIYGRVDMSSFDDRSSSPFYRGVFHYGRGLHLAGQLQNQFSVSQSSIGGGYSSFAKDQSWFVDIYRTSSSYFGDSNHAFGYYSRPIGINYKLTGFIEYLAPERDLENVVGGQVHILRKFGDVWFGLEHQRYFNKNGVKGLDESVNQAIIRMEF